MPEPMPDTCGSQQLTLQWDLCSYKLLLVLEVTPDVSAVADHLCLFSVDRSDAAARI